MRAGEAMTMQSDTLTAAEREALFARMREQPFEELRAQHDASAGTLVDDPAAAEDLASTPCSESQKVAGASPIDLVQGVAYDAGGEIIVQLRFPFTLNGARFDRVTLLPPRLDHMEAHGRGQMTKLEVIAEMASMAPAHLRALRWPDAERVLSIAAEMAPDLVQRS